MINDILASRIDYLNSLHVVKNIKKSCRVIFLDLTSIFHHKIDNNHVKAIKRGSDNITDQDYELKENM